jgi:rhodanese-related sulfurtransferase
MNIEQLIKEKKGTILDVRTPSEFQGGNAVGSVNIPLQEIQSRIEEVKSLEQPLVLCCASGGRSGQATYFLSHSINAINSYVRFNKKIIRWKIS